MRRTKFLTAISCLSLILSANAAWPIAARLRTASEVIAAGELIEAPADATAYVALGAGGHALLASGARLRLSTLAGAHDEAALLTAMVLSGDVFIKLPSSTKAIVQAGDATFLAARGAFFHAAVRDGRGAFDASDKVAMELGNWAIKLPTPINLGHWGVSLPREMAEPVLKQPARLHLDLTPRAQPIGSVTSLGAMLINERMTPRYGVLWGNELIQAPAGMSTTATLDQLGQVTLANGARARLLAATNSAAQRVLTATLLEGGATFKLDKEVAACVEAGGATFVAARGARFRVLLVEGHAVIDTASDSVLEMGDWSLAGLELLPDLMRSLSQAGQQPMARRYFVRPVGLTDNLIVRARSTRQIQVRVTDENDDPVRDAPVIFLLSGSAGKSLGVLGSTALAAATGKVFTNAQGIASISFTAAAEPAAGTITATVEGTNASWIGQINLVKVVPGFWSPQNIAPMVITAAAAGVAIGINQATVSKDDKAPVQAVGGPIIKP